ncbi:MAG: hypothetical protein KJO07_10400 [Deltaproteobacteria bacterium]|nr:hypothetical protein [Deltaproteobacteria bacterium]
MLLLSQVRGQDRAIARLQRAVAGDRVAHAYLFTGPARSGKYTSALALAAAMNCDLEPGVGCGTCAPCSKIADGIHPDVQTLQRQGAARIIPIASIRSQVLSVVGLAPHEARARFFLVEEATAMQGPAANALLKTLEEPPARTHFVLATTAPDKLLPTIRSRCQTVAFAALGADLRAQLEGDEETSGKLAEWVTALVGAALEGGDLHAAARAAGAEKGKVGDILSLLATRLHQRAVAAAQGDHGRDAARLSRQAQLVGEVELAVTQHNAHGQLALEDLLYRLRDVPR